MPTGSGPGPSAPVRTSPVTVPYVPTDDVDALLRTLTTAVATGRGVHGIAAALHLATGGTVVIEDGEGIRLAHTGDPTDPPGVLPDWASSCPDDHARSFRVGEWVLTTAQPGSEVLGVIGLHDPDHRADDQARSVLEQGALVLATELFRLRSVASNEVRIWGDLAAELLDSPDMDRARSHTAALGYLLDRPHRALVIVGDGSDPEPTMALVRRAFRVAGVDGRLLTQRATDIVALVEATADVASLASALHDQGAPSLRLGIGDPHDPVQIALSLDEAELALRLTRAPVARFDALGIARFLSADADVSRLRAFVHEWLGPLEAYDRAHHAELVHTLDHSLRDPRSVRAAAEGLNIHPSTLKYRLRRIEELTGRDLHDSETRFNLELACRIRSTLEAQSPARIELQAELPLGPGEAVAPPRDEPPDGPRPPPVEVAVLDSDGILTSVNDAWLEFCVDNGGDPTRAGIGTSYVAVCAAADGDPWADLVASLLRLAVAGYLPAPARLTVPCHSPESSRWFDMTVASRNDDAGRCCGAKITLTPSTSH